MQSSSTYHIKTRQSLQQFAVAILQPMSLVDDRNTPVNFPQLLEVGYDHLIGRDQRVETEYVGNRTTLANSNFQHINQAGTGKRKNVKYTYAEFSQQSSAAHHQFH